MVRAESEAQPEDEAEFRRRALLLLAETRDYNRRMCEIMERFFGQQPDDPRYKRIPSWK